MKAGQVPCPFCLSLEKISDVAETNIAPLLTIIVLSLLEREQILFADMKIKTKNFVEIMQITKDFLEKCRKYDNL